MNDDIFPRVAGRHVLSVSLDTSDLGIFQQAGGAAAVTANPFVAMPHDASVEEVFVSFEGVQNQTGVLTLRLMQTLADGKTQQLSRQVSLSGFPLDVVSMGTQTRTPKFGAPVYLEIVATPGTSTPWWYDVTRVNVTLHLLSTR